MSTRYTFGDGDLAARRLELLARVFEPTSRSLLAAAIGPGRDRVVDLGCGPGYTTQLIADSCRPASTVGVDSSARFVELARSLNTRSDVDFIVHDAASPPLPGAPFDGLYARLVLAHLPGPRAVAERWRNAVRLGGVMVLEEIEAIDAPPGVLRDYEGLAAALVAAEGACMYAGPLLAPFGGRCVPLRVDEATAAAIYGMNLATWGDEAVRRGLAHSADIDRLAGRLAELVGQGRGQGARDVTWVVRQVVVGV